MNDFTRIYYFVFGLITLGAAIQGLMAGSMISLVAGGICGVLILAGGFLLPGNASLALILALIGSLGIAGRFVPTYFKSHTLWPAATLALLSVVSIVLTVLAFVKK
jgi:uncharacterized membrane protein (UPF0136 family)